MMRWTADLLSAWFLGRRGTRWCEGTEMQRNEG